MARPLLSVSSVRVSLTVNTKQRTDGGAAALCATSLIAADCTALVSGARMPAAMAQCHRAEAHGQKTAHDHRGVYAVPAEVVGDPADAGAGDRRSKHVTEKPGKPGGSPCGVFGNQV